MKSLESLSKIYQNPLRAKEFVTAKGGDTCAEGSCVTDNCDVEKYYRTDDGTIEYWEEPCMYM